MAIRIDIANHQSRLPLDKRRLAGAIRAALASEGVPAARISLAVVDDKTIERLNHRYLQHDGPTDVLSFALGQSESGLEGEVIVSADTAAAQAPSYGWGAADELLLYVVHGTLHLLGYDDATDGQRRRMRARQRAVLRTFGLEVPYRRHGQAVKSRKRRARGTSAP